MQETRYHVNMPCSVALLADLHNRPCQDILASLTANCPDIICIAGDLVEGEIENSLDNQMHDAKDPEKLMELMKEKQELRQKPRM